jgi:hypothetical protein
MTTTTTSRPVHSTSREVYGIERQAEVGSVVHLDGHPFAERLLAGDPEPVGDGWPGCDFRYPNPVNEWRESHAIACNVHVTGRTLQNRFGSLWVRVSIEWVGDCEPSTYGSGWLLVRN